MLAIFTSILVSHPHHLPPHLPASPFLFSSVCVFKCSLDPMSLIRVAYVSMSDGPFF